MTRYQPCNCDHPYEECFRCAVDYVIQQIRRDPYCNCLYERAESCEDCGCALLPDWEYAFALASTPYEHLPQARARSRGLIFKRLAENLYMSRQDPDQAARELRAEVENDPVSFDAAMCFVAQCIEKQDPVPEPLRDWAVSVLRGEVQRPIHKGKYPGATRWRDALIIQLIDTMTSDMGLKATRSNAHKAYSACDAVSYAFVVLRQLPESYEGIVKIWGRRDALMGLSVPDRM